MPESRLDITAFFKSMGVDKGLEKMKKGTDKLKGAVKELSKNYISYSMLAKDAFRAISKAWDLAKLAAKQDALRQSVQNLAAEHKTTTDQIIEDLREASAATVSTLDLLKQAGKGLTLGLKPEELTEFMKGARAASRAMGEDISFMFESITTGVARQSKLWLDNLGILISVEDANKKHAEAIGKTVDKLTDQERRQAFTNEAMRQSQELVRRIGTAGLTSAEEIAQMEAKFEDARVKAGEFAQEVLLRKVDVGNVLEFWIGLAETLADKLFPEDAFDRMGNFSTKTRGELNKMYVELSKQVVLQDKWVERLKGNEGTFAKWSSQVMQHQGDALHSLAQMIAGFSDLDVAEARSVDLKVQLAEVMQRIKILNAEGVDSGKEIIDDLKKRTELNKLLEKYQGLLLTDADKIAAARKKDLDLLKEMPEHLKKNTEAVRAMINAYYDAQAEGKGGDADTSQVDAVRKEIENFYKTQTQIELDLLTEKEDTLAEAIRGHREMTLQETQFFVDEKVRIEKEGDDRIKANKEKLEADEAALSAARHSAWMADAGAYKSSADSIAKMTSATVKQQAMIMIPFEIAQSVKEMAVFLETMNPTHLASSLQHAAAAKAYADAAKAGSPSSPSGSGSSAGSSSAGAEKERAEKEKKRRTRKARVIVNIGDGIVTNPKQFMRDTAAGLNEAYQDDVHIEFAQ